MLKQQKIFLFVWIVLYAMGAAGARAQEDSVTVPNQGSVSYEANLKRWQNMSEAQREAIRQKAQAMTAPQREALLENAKNFYQLPPKEQARIQTHFQAFKKMPQKEQQKLMDRSRHFQKLPPEKRAEWRKQSREMKGPPAEKSSERQLGSQKGPMNSKVENHAPGKDPKNPRRRERPVPQGQFYRKEQGLEARKEPPQKHPPKESQKRRERDSEVGAERPLRGDVSPAARNPRRPKKAGSQRNFMR